MISGLDLGINTTLRAIQRRVVIFNFVRDVTPMPHNGCRPPKKRRV
jgi:small subunit ribosomal protein S11